MSMASKSLLDAEVSSTVKSSESLDYEAEEEEEEEDNEVLRINYKELPEDYFDSLIEVDEWHDDVGKKVPAATKPKIAGTVSKKPSTTDKTKETPKETRPKETAKENRPKETAKETRPKERSKSPPKKKAKSPEKSGKASPKRKRSNSPNQRKSKSPSRRSISPQRKRSRSPVRRPRMRRSPIRRLMDRRVSPLRRPRKRSISPSRRSSPRRRRSISPRKRSVSPSRQRSSRSPAKKRSRSPDLFSARMSSRRRQFRGTSQDRESGTSLSPEGSSSRVKRPLRLDRTYAPPVATKSRTRSPPSYSSNSGPTLQEIANGSVPYAIPNYPYGPPMGGPPMGGPMMYYPHGAYPPHPMGYPHPHPQVMPPYAAVPPAPTITADAAGLSTAYPLPVPVPKPSSLTPDYSPVLPPRAAKKPHADKRMFIPSLQDSAPSVSSVASNDSEDTAAPKSSKMKLSDYLASMTASQKPMEYNKAVDERIKKAIEKFDDTFLQPLRFTVTNTEVPLEPEKTSPFMSPLLKNPVTKLGNFIRPLNLRALKLPERPQFMCRRPELVVAKPEISIKTLLSKKQAVKRDAATSPIEFLSHDVDCQTDPIPKSPPPPCFACEERSMKTFMNHWTQVKRVDTVDSMVQTVDPVRVAPSVAHRLGPIVEDVPVMIRDPYDDRRRNLNSRSNSPWTLIEEPRVISPFLLDNRMRSRSRSPTDFDAMPLAPRYSRSPTRNYSPPEDFRRSPGRFGGVDRSPPVRFSGGDRSPAGRFSGGDRSPPGRFSVGDRSPPGRFSGGDRSPPPVHNRRFRCEECDVICNTIIQLENHQNSRRHVVRMETLQRELRESRDSRQHFERRNQRDHGHSEFRGGHKSAYYD